MAAVVGTVGIAWHLPRPTGGKPRRGRRTPHRRPDSWTVGRIVRLVAILGLGALASLALSIAATAAAARERDQQPVVLGASIRQPAAQHSLLPLAAVEFRNPQATTRAVDYILSLQPEGTYILTSAGSDDVVHMDVAHAALALAKADRVPQAEAALNWLLARMTTPADADRFGTTDYATPETAQLVDYSGSWWDHLQTTGLPKRDQTRGRAEGVGLALVAVYSVYQADPGYLNHPISSAGTDLTGADAAVTDTVADRVALAARYLASPAIQHADGRFNHRPDYTVSFAEEGARMVLGLRLGAEMLNAVGRTDEAAQANAAADRGFAALRDGEGVNRGMAYDYYALGIWGLATPDEAHAELVALDRANLTTRAGVRNYDWQVRTAPKLMDRLRFWGQSIAIAPSESFDWAIAATTAGDLGTALDVERQWTALQRADGGFPAAYLQPLGIAFGAPTSYSAARFVMLERVLTQVAEAK